MEQTEALRAVIRRLQEAAPSEVIATVYCRWHAGHAATAIIKSRDCPHSRAGHGQCGISLTIVILSTSLSSSVISIPVHQTQLSAHQPSASMAAPHSWSGTPASSGGARGAGSGSGGGGGGGGGGGFMQAAQGSSPGGGGGATTESSMSTAMMKASAQSPASLHHGTLPPPPPHSWHPPGEKAPRMRSGSGCSSRGILLKVERALLFLVALRRCNQQPDEVRMRRPGASARE